MDALHDPLAKFQIRISPSQAPDTTHERRVACLAMEKTPSIWPARARIKGLANILSSFTAVKARLMTRWVMSKTKWNPMKMIKKKVASRCIPVLASAFKGMHLGIIVAKDAMVFRFLGPLVHLGISRNGFDLHGRPLAPKRVSKRSKRLCRDVSDPSLASSLSATPVRAKPSKRRFSDEHGEKRLVSAGTSAIARVSQVRRSGCASSAPSRDFRALHTN